MTGWLRTRAASCPSQPCLSAQLPGERGRPAGMLRGCGHGPRLREAAQPALATGLLAAAAVLGLVVPPPRARVAGSQEDDLACIEIRIWIIIYMRIDPCMALLVGVQFIRQGWP